jgi:D-alanine-D-alanine ligase-like ATP-grasp enzyme
MSPARSSIPGERPLARLSPVLSRALGLLGGGPATALAQIRRVAEIGPWQALQYRRVIRDYRRGGPAPEHDVYAEIWGEAATELGAEMVRYPHGFLELRSGGTAVRVRDNWTPLDDVVARALSLDKSLVHQRLAAAGVPVPEHAEFTPATVDVALRFLQRTDGPVIVKPATGTGGGEGVAGGIRSRSDLLRAVIHAARLPRRLLIECQGRGNMYRILLLDGELVDIVARHPTRLTGDGRSSIAELVANENRRRIAAHGRAGLMLVTLNLDCEIALRSAGYSMRSVLPAGETVAVKTISSDAGANDNETIRESPAEDVLADARTAAAAIGARVAGVDVVAPDLSRGLRASGGFVIEVNCPPGLQHHYQVREPQAATKVAVPILRALLQEGESPAGGLTPERR